VKITGDVIMVRVVVVVLCWYNFEVNYASVHCVLFVLLPIAIMHLTLIFIHYILT